MDYQTTPAGPIEVDADLLVIPVCSEALADKHSTCLRKISEKTHVDLFSTSEQEGFEGNVGQSLLFRRLPDVGAKRILLVGIGDASDIDGDGLYRAGARAGRRAYELRARRVALAMPDRLTDRKSPARAVRQLVGGFAAGIYRFDKYLQREQDGYEGPESLELSSEDEEVGRALEHAKLLGDGVAIARDLVNEPPGVLTPEAMADHAVAIASEGKLEHTVFNGSEVTANGFKLIEAVGKGSDNPPQLIHLVYRPDGEVHRKVALVGKGITFDTGGYSMKRPEQMKFMHADMAGGAAVLGAAHTIGQLKPEGVEIHFIVPAAENAVSGSATRPADIVRGYGGKTVQILNTDAEGRLVLADALAYAQEQEVDTIVDLATLTGSSVVALGGYSAALFSDDDDLVDQLDGASRLANESLWRMPLTPEIDKQLDSPVADMKNVGRREGGAISAALFLKRWVDLDRWAHLDIAGPAYWPESDDYRISGGTGFGVATLVEFVESLATA